MDENKIEAYGNRSTTNFGSSSDSEAVNDTRGSRRMGMRFSSIGEFLASLNTATTTMTALQGLQNMSLESYKECMPGAQPEVRSGDTSQERKYKIAKIEKCESDVKDN